MQNIDSSFAKTTDGGRIGNFMKVRLLFGDWTPNFFFIRKSWLCFMNHPYETFDGGKTGERIGEAEQWGVDKPI
ncbi:MAG: hypothetical protein IPL01_22990 [Acidobacteria bacterium]|nr:hypothetical protein [Acidobacteriota bacterium]